jgi:hypothetical protein
LIFIPVLGILRLEDAQMARTDRATMRQAAEMLGVSHAKIWQLVKDHVLPAEPNPLDRREKLIRVADIDRLRAQGSRTKTPWPSTIGAADLGVQSDELEDWLEANWHPC